MAVVEYFQNMYDFKLKPRLLRSLMKEHLPDENHPLSSSLELSNVVSAIKTHGLLIESFGEAVGKKLLDKWASAVDAFVDRLLLLVSSNMPDKCWAGICLLGVTCQECSTDRFLTSYSSWFQKLLSHIQPPSDSQFVKVATCASLSDLFTRLSGISNVKDGTSLAAKLIQPVLKLLTEESSEAVWEGAVDLLCTLLNFFPSSVYRHYESAEAVIVSKMYRKCTSNTSKCNLAYYGDHVKKFANCLAMLPKAKGDEDSWSLMMQKILISITIHLNDAFQGLEEENKCSEAMRLLVPPGKDPPSPLGGQTSREASDQVTEGSDMLFVSRVSTLMMSCSTMLTNPYPVQVTVPVHSLLALIRRVLLVDGSLSQALIPFLTVTQQADICSKLPILHMCSLDLLIAVIKGIRSQLLPNAADIVRLLIEYFRRCMLPALRMKVYSIMKTLLISMGVGIAPYLAQEVIDNAFADLDPYSIQNDVASHNTYSKPATYVLQRSSKRKRKHGTEDDQNGAGLVLEVPKSKPLTSIAVQIGALEALEALLTVGGALKSECWRPNVGLLLVTVATNACDGGWGTDEKIGHVVSSELTTVWADFQLATLSALLASLLSPVRVRPTYLSQGFQLFRRGKQEAGTKLAGFCAHALLALEVLIHPRALPLMNSSFSNCGSFEKGFDSGFQDKVLSSGQKDSNPFSRGAMGISDADSDDELYKTWLGNGDDIETPVTRDRDKKTESSYEPSQVCDQQAREDVSPVEPTNNSSDVAPVATKSNREQPTDSVNVETERSADEFMVDTETLKVQIAVGDVRDWDKGAVVATQGSSNLDRGTMSSDDTGLDGGDLITTNSVSVKGKELMFEDDSDMDSIPDIICNPPDSDQEIDM